MISPSAEWRDQISAHLESADLILLLVSAHFLASDYAYEEEMMRAMAKHKQGSARVIPVILRPCAWQRAPFGALQALPRDGKPVSEWRSRAAAFLNVVEGIERVIRDRVDRLGTPAANWTRALLIRRSVVRFAQEFLASHGYYKGEIDGDPGIGTYHAIHAFQADNDLETDGLIGPETLERMSSLLEQERTHEATGG